MSLRLSVIQLGGGPAVWYAAWLFHQHGHYVTLVEGFGPGEELVDQYSRGFLGSAHTKVMAHTDPAWREAAATSDVVLGDPAAPWAELALSTPATGTVDDLSADEASGDWASCELVLASHGGATGYTSDPMGRPIYGFGDRFAYLAGLQLYTALVAELVAGASVPEVHPAVRVSALETVAWLLPYPTTQVQYNGSTSSAEQSGPRFVCACTDGWVAIYAGRAWEDLARTLGGLVDNTDARFIAVTDRFAHAAALGEKFDIWCAERSVTQAVADGGRHDVAVTHVVSPLDLVSGRRVGEAALPQLPARRFDREPVVS